MKSRKTAVSIPDDLFEAADAVAKRLGLSRSGLYARALEAFIAAHGGADVTRALDRVYSRERSSIDPALLRAQIRSLPREDW